MIFWSPSSCSYVRLPFAFSCLKTRNQRIGWSLRLVCTITMSVRTWQYRQKNHHINNYSDFLKEYHFNHKGNHLAAKLTSRQSHYIGNLGKVVKSLKIKKKKKNSTRAWNNRLHIISSDLTISCCLYIANIKDLGALSSNGSNYIILIRLASWILPLHDVRTQH